MTKSREEHIKARISTSRDIHCLHDELIIDFTLESYSNRERLYTVAWHSDSSQYQYA
jgi:hypothetical protein